MKHWIETGDIIYYNSYADNILMISDSNKINGKIIYYHMKALYQHLEFKQTEEYNGTINYLDLTINCNNNNLTVESYRKQTQT
jgi:hypothetical protein